MNDLSNIKNQIIQFIQLYIEEVKKLVLSPSLFFRENREKTGLLDPTIFACVNILIPKVLFALLIAPFTLGISILFVIPSVFYGVASLFIASIVLHGLIRLCGGHEHFELTYRITAYSSLAYYAWLLPFPFLNLLVFTISFCTLMYIAMREIHELTPQQAVLILIVPAFLIFLAGAILSFVSVWVIYRIVLNILDFTLSS